MSAWTAYHYTIETLKILIKITSYCLIPLHKYPSYHFLCLLVSNMNVDTWDIILFLPSHFVKSKWKFYMTKHEERSAMLRFTHTSSFPRVSVFTIKTYILQYLRLTSLNAFHSPAVSFTTLDILNVCILYQQINSHLD